MRFKWDENNIQILMENYGIVSDSDIMKMLNCKDVRSVSKKAMELGIWIGKRITGEEEDFIVKNYGVLTSIELGEILDKCQGAITRIWRKHGCRKETFKWTNEKISILKDLYPRASREEIISTLGTPNWDSVANKAEKLRLKRFWTITKDDLLSYLLELSQELGRTPTRNELKKYSSHPYDTNFGSFSKACEILGMIPNMSRRGGIVSSQLYSKNGDKCYSAPEVLITDFFIEQGIPYEKEVLYSEICDDLFFGKMRADWIIHKRIVVEYFGMASDEYKQKTKLKLKLCKKNKIEIIPIYPSNNLSPEHLQKLFDSY
jgi:hypothetical protein